MNYTEIVSDVLQKQPALVTTGLGFIVLFFVLAVISIFDATQILGINRWIKPMKFAASIFGVSGFCSALLEPFQKK